MINFAILHPPSFFALVPISANTPFVTPLPVWDYWYLLLIPLSAAVAIVWKSIKCNHMSEVPRAATIIFVWILLGMVAAGGVLAGIVIMKEM